MIYIFLLLHLPDVTNIYVPDDCDNIYIFLMFMFLNSVNVQYKTKQRHDLEIPDFQGKDCMPDRFHPF